MTKYLSSCLFLFLICCTAKNEIDKPNILFILADDLGYSDLSCMGSEFYETPNIDEISEQGMLFTNGYAGCQVCSPSRATLMTGQFTARHGITDWIGSPSGEAWRNKKRFTKVLPASYEHHLKKETITLPEALKSAGYKTFFAGKWHLGEQGNYPEDHGFEINKGGYSSGSPRGGYFGPINNPKLEKLKNGENLSIRLAQETADFMKASRGEPFFAFLSFYAVHGPIQTNKRKWEKYRNKVEKKGIEEFGFEEGDLLPMRKYQDNPVYGGLVETMDDAVGIVMKSLKENNLDKNTIVVFTSDNGGVTSGDNYSTNNMPLKGGKGYQWEGGIRIPYIINVPWMNLQGKSNSTPVSGSDFYPTILELVGLSSKSKSQIDGKSIVPVLEGKSIEERPLYWHYPHYGNQGGRPVSIIRQGDYKLIHFWEDGRNELYNLVEDIHEDNNIAEHELKKTAILSTSLMRWLESVDAKYPSSDPLYDSIKEQDYLKKMKQKKIKALEYSRREMLSQDWQPNKNWWGSNPTID